MYISLTFGRSYTLKEAPYVIQHTYCIRQQEVLLWLLALLQQLWDRSDNLFPIWLHADEFHTLCSETHSPDRNRSIVWLSEIYNILITWDNFYMNAPQPTVRLMNCITCQKNTLLQLLLFIKPWCVIYHNALPTVL